jgi:hypothetical protein
MCGTPPRRRGATVESIDAGPRRAVLLAGLLLVFFAAGFFAAVFVAGVLPIAFLAMALRAGALAADFAGAARLAVAFLAAAVFFAGALRTTSALPVDFFVAAFRVPVDVPAFFAALARLRAAASLRPLAAAAARRDLVSPTALPAAFFALPAASRALAAASLTFPVAASALRATVVRNSSARSATVSAAAEMVAVTPLPLLICPPGACMRCVDCM